MKLLWVVSIILFGQSPAFAMCTNVADYEGTYEILEISDAQITCEAKPKGSLLLPGCKIRLIDQGSKTDLTVYGDSEVCSLKKGAISQMKITGACCDVEEAHPCRFYEDGKFRLKRSYEQYSCLGRIGKYVTSYSFKKNEKDVFRNYSSIKKVFTDAVPGKIAKPAK